MSKLESALAHVAAGLWVFPVSKTKGTVTPHGVHDATKDPDKVCEFWSEHPDANVAVAGGKSNNTVCDIDYGLESEAHFHEWRERNGIPRTYTVRSGSRPAFKVHMYFAEIG